VRGSCREKFRTTRFGAVKTFTVYQVDEMGKSRVRVGTLVERRIKDRGNNLAGLLRLAVDQYKSSPSQTIQVDLSGILLEL
jgi:hypothetical protein